AKSQRALQRPPDLDEGADNMDKPKGPPSRALPPTLPRLSAAGDKSVRGRVGCAGGGSGGANGVKSVAMRILLTGAAGFIGSHVAEALLTRGDEVVGLDNFNDFYDPALKRRNITAV